MLRSTRMLLLASESVFVPVLNLDVLLCGQGLADLSSSLRFIKVASLDALLTLLSVVWYWVG